MMRALVAALLAALGAAEAPPLLLPDRSWFSQVARVRQRSSALSPGACEAVGDALRPGTRVKGYELVERAALLGVCSLQAPSIAPVATRAVDAVVPVRQFREWEEPRSSGSAGVCPLIPPPDAAGHLTTSQIAPLELIDGPVLEYQYVEADLERLYVNAHYRLKDRFDAGSHGEVWKATAATDGHSVNAPRFVLKRLFLQLGEEMVHMGLREAHFGEILAGEPHVTRFVEYFFRPPLASTSTSSTVSPTPRGADGKHGSDSSARDNNDAAARTPELWLVFHDEGMSLRHFLYEKQETFAGSEQTKSSHEASGVILKRSRFWEKMRADAKGELVLREIMRQLLEGVAALHNRGITHRDIKPSNILLTIPVVSGTNVSIPVVKLADFGSAVDEYAAQHLYPPDSGPSQAEETREYQPPEVLFSNDGQPYDFEFPLAYDMWSVGVVFLEMVLGSPQVFLISSRAQAKLDAELQQRQRERKNSKKHSTSIPGSHEDHKSAQQSKSYLLHVLTHEFCIFRPPPNQLRSLWDKYALVSDSCHFGKFNETVVARDPLHKGLALPFALDLMWKLLQWSPRDRISARDALNHAFFRGPYVCARTGRKFSTEKELHVHERYLRTQAARDNALAFVVRERVPLPGDESDGSHAFVCPKCKRSFATLDSCEHHTHARRHYDANGSQFCTFNAERVLDAVRRETYHSNTHAFVNLSTVANYNDPLLTSTASFDVGMALFQGRKKYMEDFVLVQPAPDLATTHPEERGSQPVVFAVSDGHLGDAAATFVLEHLVEALTRNFAAVPPTNTMKEANADPDLAKTTERNHQEEIAIRQTFLELHERFLQETKGATRSEGEELGDEALFSGCTLTVAVLFPRENRVVAANVGDSRAFVWLHSASNSSDEFVIAPLSMDHWPDVPSERSRIESSGGFVHFQGLWRVVGQLAVSRSLGDRHLRRYVTAEPSVFHLDLSTTHQDKGGLLVLASDGLWETMDSAQVSHFIHARCRQAGGFHAVDLDALATELAAQSYVRGGLDNTAILLVRLP